MNAESPKTLNLDAVSPAVATLIAELAANPLEAFEWLDSHMGQVINESIQEELNAAIPQGLPAEYRQQLEGALLYRMLISAGMQLGAHSGGHGRSMAASIRFRCLLLRFRDTARARDYSRDCLEVIDRAHTLARGSADPV